MPIEKQTITKRGKEELETELRNLIDVERPKVIEAIVAARAQGDLSENADYDAARNRQAEVEGRIAQIENILNNCIIVEDRATSSKVVSLGTKVRFKDLSDGEIYDYQIVGTIEANPMGGKISNDSPIGKALQNHKVGDHVLIEVGTPYEIEILEIKLSE